MSGLVEVRSIEECASYLLTVQPYWQWLKESPLEVLSAITHNDPITWYQSTNPLLSSALFSLIVAVTVFFVSEINRNYSQIDRLWSILPTLYIAHMNVWARLAGIDTAKLDLVLLCSTTWSVRLSYNYWRRGGYERGSEDYRWEVVRKYLPAPAFFILNVTFISTIQSVLLWLMSAGPVYVILLRTSFDPTITSSDYFFTSALLALVVIEWFADGQQWDYQSAKRCYLASAKVPSTSKYTVEELSRGFMTSGLWAWSRHPNYAAEQTFWFALYLWSAVASSSTSRARFFSSVPSPLTKMGLQENVLLLVDKNWAMIGSLSLIILFQASTLLTEVITLRKYPGYADYRRQVSRFVPLSLRSYSAPTLDKSQKQRIAKTAKVQKQQ